MAAAARNPRPRLGIVVAGPSAVTAVEAYSALRDSYDLVFLVAAAAPNGDDGDSSTAAKLESAMRALARRVEVCWLPAGGQPPRAAPSGIGDLIGITTFSADGVEVACRLASELGLPALGADGGRSLYDKVAQRAALGSGLSPRSLALPRPCCSTGFAVPDGQTRCDEQGGRAPREWERAAARLSFPAVLKPARGQASRGVRRVEDVADLRAAWDEIVRAATGHRASTCPGGVSAPDADPEWLLEEFLPGSDGWPRAAYVSVESVVSRSDVRHMALTRKLPMAEPFREVGQYLLPPALEQGDDHGALLDAASDALSRLRVENAVTHTELKLTPDGPKVIEVNARVGGLVRDLVKAGRGVDLARAAAAVAVGDLPDSPDQPVGGERTGDLVFQYGPLAPVPPAVFQGAHGVDAVSSLPGVDRYVPHVAVGELLCGGTGTQTMAVVSGTCRDEEELAAVVMGIERALCYDFRLHPDGQPMRCDARGIPIDRSTQ